MSQFQGSPRADTDIPLETFEPRIYSYDSPNGAYRPAFNHDHEQIEVLGPVPFENGFSVPGPRYRSQSSGNSLVSEFIISNGLDLPLPKETPVESAEDEKKRHLRSRIRLHGQRKCWAKYCWADKTDTKSHSHPLEILSTNRVKLMATSDQLIDMNVAMKFLRILEDNTEKVIRTVDFYDPVYKRIQGYFGSGIASYVGLINRLLGLSLYIFLLVGGLFVAPSMVNYYQYQSLLWSFSNSSTTRDQLETEILTSYTRNPDYVRVNNITAKDALYLQMHGRLGQLGVVDTSVAQTLLTTALQLLQGTGWLETTWLYLGQYPDRINLLSNATINGSLYDKAAILGAFNGSPFPYSLPFAYMCSIFGAMLLSLIVLISSSGTSLKENLKGRHARAYPFCEVVFGNWMHGIQMEAGVENQKVTETSQLKILLSGAQQRAPSARSAGKTAVLYLIRLAVWMLVLGLLAGFGALMYFTVILWVPTELQDIALEMALLANGTTPDASSAMLEARELLFNFLPSILITAFNFLIPMLLSFLAQFEAYATAKVEIRITIVRTVALRFASIAFLLFSLVSELKPKTDLPSTTSPLNVTYGLVIKDPSRIPCFETYVGQQIYKVLLLDMLIFIAVFMFLQIPVRLLYKATKWGLLRMEFDLTGNILSAIYIQCLYWLGIYFAPLLSAMAILHFFLRAVIGQIGLFLIYETPRKIHHSTGSDVFFTIVALLAFFFSLGIIGFAVIAIKPSAVCGPLAFNPNYSVMYDYFMGTLEGYAGEVKLIVRYFTSAVVLFPITVLVAVFLYYKVARASAKAAGIQILKKKIEDATGQKKFLERKARQKNVTKVD